MSLRFTASLSDRCAASLPANFNCWVSFFHDATLLGVHSLSSTVKAFSIAANLAVKRLCELVRGDVAHSDFIHAQKHVKNEKKTGVFTWCGVIPAAT